MYREGGLFDPISSSIEVAEFMARLYVRFFPEIRRAWASVDNSLFLWRFDKRTEGLDLPDVLVEVEKCGSSFDELLAVPEQDDWI
ncbi:hypothetical protein DY000_02059923 [Brassica cretica]|uniref:Nucleoporin Nup133/Nup155-like N-terminal domain-containing protein n=1 Tax=Brassica cretica TaxID=69181 RepID=A0ABQ7B0N5_BRACR|nr:hypothetical protein DY000_02059923 [Brassica cretica]